MNAHTLAHFRNLADALGKREKADMTISFQRKDGRKEVINAKYDPLFKSVELGNATVPAVELKHWLKLLYGAKEETVVVTY